MTAQGLWLGAFIIFAAGYVASVFTWPALHKLFISAKAREEALLRELNDVRLKLKKE